MKATSMNIKSKFLFDGRLRSAERSSAAFSLIEILVVVAILALLVGLLLPSINRMRDQAKIASSQANINLIAAGVDMYELDFNSLPPSEHDGATYIPDWKGAELICLFMTGYADDKPTKGEPFDDGDFSEDDGKDGFGFRAEKRGRVYGPYNGTENINVALSNNEYSGLHPKVFIDSFDNPILYYKYNGSIYDTDDNDGVYAASIGDPDQTDYLNPMRDHQGTRKFLLLTAGMDGNWGVDADQHFPGTDPEYKWSDFDDLGNFEKK